MSDTIRDFEDSALVWVRISANKPKMAGKVLESSDVSTREHGHKLYKIELEQTYTGLDNQEHVSRWVHPKPVQGYKLSRRYEDK